MRPPHSTSLPAFLRASVSPWLIALSLVAPTKAQTITFRDITAQAGIHFTHNNGAFGKKWLPETMGPGCAFIDYDNDGFPDILLVNGQDLPGHASVHRTNGASTLQLYHNNHDGTFTDVTRKSGLGISLFGLGVAVGDYDNDGFDDIFITAVGQSHLFHNNGNGTFTDVTKTAGLWGPNEFSTSAAWVDYDRDGKLDLVVANYVQWTEQSDLVLHAGWLAQVLLHARIVQGHVGAPLAQPWRRQVRRRHSESGSMSIRRRRDSASPFSITTMMDGPTS